MEDSVDHDIERAREGDRDALDRVIRATARQVTHIVANRLGPHVRRRVRPSDVFQSTYLQVIRDIESFEGDQSAFLRWVGRIVENNIRMKARFHHAARRDAGREVEGETDDWVVHGGPVSELSRIEDLLRVGRALDRIPADYRDVILLRTVDGLTHEELATKLERSSGAVRMLLSRARAALTLEMEKLTGEDPAAE